MSQKKVQIKKTLGQQTEDQLMKGCTIIYVAVDGMAAGYLALSDTVRKESPDMIDRLTE